jgi:hypothetical protein
MKRKIALLIFLAFALPSCASINYYKVPDGLTAVNAATIVDNKVESGGNFVRDVRTYVARVDGAPISRQNATENSVLVSEGEHDIMIGVSGGENMMLSYRRSGVANIKADFKAGAVYVVRSNIFQISVRTAEATVWIEEKNGTLATEKVTIPVTTARPVAVPIIIPAK